MVVISSPIHDRKEPKANSIVPTIITVHKHNPTKAGHKTADHVQSTTPSSFNPTFNKTKHKIHLLIIIIYIYFLQVMLNKYIHYLLMLYE